MKTKIVNINEAQPLEVHNTLENGNVIAYPTDTIYGIGADIYNNVAVEKLFATKERDYAKPVSLLYFDKEKVFEDFNHLSDYETKFIEEFFPGPITLILQVKDENKFPFPFINNGFVGIRVINLPQLNSLMKKYPNPITTTSINPSGMKPAKNCNEILSYFPDHFSLIIDAGSSGNSIGSTVIKVGTANYQILRESAVSANEVEKRILNK